MERSVLVIERDAHLKLLFSHILGTDGYRTLLADSWREAQSIIANALPDLIIFDCMPTDASGYLWADDMRTTPTTAHIPLLVIVSAALPRAVARLLSDAGISVIEKPFDLFVFRRYVTALLMPRERMANAGFIG